MTGFEDYQPSKWKNGVFAAPPAPKPPAKKRAARAHNVIWLTKSTMTVSVPAGAVAVSNVPLDLGRHATATPLREAGQAPEGYFAKLQRAMAGAPRLPEPSRNDDPDFSF